MTAGAGLAAAGVVLFAGGAIAADQVRPFGHYEYDFEATPAVNAPVARDRASLAQLAAPESQSAAGTSESGQTRPTETPAQPVTAGDVDAPEAPARSALPDDNGVFTLQLENDLFAGFGEDDQYTHGTMITYVTGADEVPDYAMPLANLVHGAESKKKVRGVFALGQNMYTPNDIATGQLQRNDRPYAGWLYAGAGVMIESDNFLDKLQLDLGVVGPASLAEPTQKLVHHLINSQRPNGWDHQLSFEPTVNAYFDRQFLIGQVKLSDETGIDFVPHVGAAVGNALTYGAVGGSFRIGSNLDDQFSPPRIQPSLPAPGYFETRDVDWYLKAGVETRFVARNIFLDGNTFSASHSVDKRNIVTDFEFGAGITLGDVRLSYTNVWRTEEFALQDGMDNFGAISMSYRF